MRCNIGIYNLHMAAMGGGEKLTLVLAEQLSLSHNVRLFCAEPLDVASLEKFFAVDLRRVEIVPLKSPGSLSRLASRVNGNSRPALSQHHYLQLRQFNLDIFINNSYASELMCPATHGIFMCMFPHRPSVAVTKVVDSYSKVVAISRYSADWVYKRWGYHSDVIYPPCDDTGPPAAKEKIILHVGRFISDHDQDERHHKGQGLLIETFKQMQDLHRDGWKLHLTGSAATDPRSRKFAASLSEEADGVPVFFHFNAPRQEMRELYRRAAIYWHATGYGVDPNQYPSKQEHFGIATVEAMTAGAVPVVYSTGGQKEIVTDGVDGFWWNEIDGLTTHTRSLANDEDLRCKLGEQAVVSSKRFSRDAFASRIDSLIAELLLW